MHKKFLWILVFLVLGMPLKAIQRFAADQQELIRVGVGRVGPIQWRGQTVHPAPNPRAATWVQWELSASGTPGPTPVFHEQVQMQVYRSGSVASSSTVTLNLPPESNPECVILFWDAHDGLRALPKEAWLEHQQSMVREKERGVEHLTPLMHSSGSSAAENCCSGFLRCLKSCLTCWCRGVCNDLNDNTMPEVQRIVDYQAQLAANWYTHGQYYAGKGYYNAVTSRFQSYRP